MKDPISMTIRELIMEVLTLRKALDNAYKEIRRLQHHVTVHH